MRTRRTTLRSHWLKIVLLIALLLALLSYWYLSSHREASGSSTQQEAELNKDVNINDKKSALKALEEIKKRVVEVKGLLTGLNKQVSALEDQINDDLSVNAASRQNGDCNTNCRIAIVMFHCFGTLCNGEAPPYIQRSINNKRQYADYWGYDVIVEGVDSIDKERKMVWGKINAIRAHLMDYEWILWLDIDTIIMNPRISIEFLLQQAFAEEKEEDDINLIISKDWNGINAGVFLMKNSSWSYTVLDEIYEEYEATRESFQEQAAMSSVLRSTSPRNYKIIPQRSFNSYPQTAPVPETANVYDIWYQPGDFIVHLAGCGDNPQRNCADEFTRLDASAQSISPKRVRRTCKPRFLDYHIKHYPHGHSHQAEY